MNEWHELKEFGQPSKPGIYLCVVHGDTSIKLIHYSESYWKYMQGLECKKVSHWLEIPELPIAIRMNMLFKKASQEGLSKEEKEELSKLLLCA